MSQNSPPKPTGAELELLQVLWERGPLTVREIHDSLGGTKDTGYTTTLKILQKMTAKGLVRRDETQRSHIYHPALQAEQTRSQLVRDLLQRAFGGSPGKLMIAALSGKKTTAAERGEIRRLLDEMESETRPSPSSDSSLSSDPS